MTQSVVWKQLLVDWHGCTSSLLIYFIDSNLHSIAVPFSNHHIQLTFSRFFIFLEQVYHKQWLVEGSSKQLRTMVSAPIHCDCQSVTTLYVLDLFKHRTLHEQHHKMTLPPTLSWQSNEFIIPVTSDHVLK